LGSSSLFGHQPQIKTIGKRIALGKERIRFAGHQGFYDFVNALIVQTDGKRVKVRLPRPNHLLAGLPDMLYGYGFVITFIQYPHRYPLKERVDDPRLALRPHKPLFRRQHIVV
jgi:hypothetical protein